MVNVVESGRKSQRSGGLYGDTQRRGRKVSQGYREQRRALSKRMDMCERQVGQEGSTAPRSIPAADQGGTLRRDLFPSSLSL